jgi:anti-sigma B factor antagonist
VHTRRFARPNDPTDFHCSCASDCGVVTVSPVGELDLATAPLLEAELRRTAGSRELVVDLRRLTFIDSSGVHVLLRWAGDAARRRREFRVIPGAERVQLVLGMTGVLETLGLDRPRMPV